MFWMGVLAFMAAWTVALLVWVCLAKAKEGDEALEELNERIRQLQQIATSLARTGGRSAALIRRRAQPIRHFLERIGDDFTQPQRR